MTNRRGRAALDDSDATGDATRDSDATGDATRDALVAVWDVTDAWPRSGLTYPADAPKEWLR